MGSDGLRHPAQQKRERVGGPALRARCRGAKLAETRDIRLTSTGGGVPGMPLALTGASSSGTAVELRLECLALGSQEVDIADASITAIRVAGLDDQSPVPAVR